MLLVPFSLVYRMITSFRNTCYDKGWFQSYQMPVALVSVGNLKAGGTGKTPFTQFLADHYCNRYKTAILSRGYGRTTKGFVLADHRVTSSEIGDEPLQMYLSAKDRYYVAVCEDRVEGVKQLLRIIPALQLVILDDAFQHRRIQRDVNIVLTEQADPFWKDSVLPAGRLRESRIGAKRADVLVITKANPSFSVIERIVMPYLSDGVPVIATGIDYKELHNQAGRRFLDKTMQIILVTGIANAQPLIDYIAQKANLCEHISFRDHHIYSPIDIERIQRVQAANTDAIIVTTEKDWVKLNPLLKNSSTLLQWYYLPIGLHLYTEKELLFSVINKGIKQRLAAFTNEYNVE